MKEEIAETIARLKKSIENNLRGSGSQFREPLLFDEVDEQRGHSEVTAPFKPRFPEKALRVYAKDLAEHALKHLPYAASCRGVDEFRAYLIQNLAFNSLSTRRRNADYLINRFFPGNMFNDDLPAFAAAMTGRPGLGEALFYLTCKTEKLVAMVAEQVIFPALAQGGVSRDRIRDLVQTLLPNSKSSQQVSSAIVNNYLLCGIGSATRTRVSVSLREGSLPAFAYVLHLEFPEGGMHGFEQLLNGPMHRWLLWDKQWIVSQLYRLRDAGLLAKVSEIDRLRQFTMKYALGNAVKPIVALAKGALR